MLQIHAFVFFFFNDTATTEIYTLSLHDALPISADLPPPDPLCARRRVQFFPSAAAAGDVCGNFHRPDRQDRKSTRLNSSHSQISYAVFCLKKKNRNNGKQSSILHFRLRVQMWGR